MKVLTAVGGVLSLEARLAAHEAAIGADGVLAVPGAAHRAPKLPALVLVCEGRRREKTEVELELPRGNGQRETNEGNALMRVHARRFPPTARPPSPV